MQHKSFTNPIDKIKTTDTPGLLPYAHSVGSAIIRPLDQGRTKGLALQAMYEQTNVQLQQIKQQVELLISQAQQIHDRIQISESIYDAECKFKPRVGHTYHLYQRANGQKILSMLSPAEWGGAPPYTFEATVKMLADHTWEILEKNE